MTSGLLSTGTVHLLSGQQKGNRTVEDKVLLKSPQPMLWIVSLQQVSQNWADVTSAMIDEIMTGATS